MEIAENLICSDLTTDPGLENRDYGRRDTSLWPRGTLYSQKLALTSLTIGCRSVDIVLSRTQATEFFSLQLISSY
jgi:hypothetical protein